MQSEGLDSIPIDDQREEDLRAGKTLLQAALAGSGDAVFISDVDGRFIEFNDAFASFHRFANREQCARTLAEYPAFLDVHSMSGELLPVEQWAVPRALRGESATGAEFILRRRDTGERWIGRYNFAPIRDRAGRIIGSVVTGRDVTAEKEAEQALRTSEERLRLAIAAASLGTWHWDIAGGTLIWSDACAAMFGLAPGTTMTYRGFLEAIHPDDRDRIGKAVEQAFATGGDYSEEMRTVWPDGSQHWIFSKGRVMYDADRRPLRMEGIVIDITERKRSELELLGYRSHLEDLVATRTAELEAANRELSRNAERIADLYNRAPCGYHSLDADGVIVSVNDTELTMLGYAREEYVGRKITDFMTPGSRIAFANRFGEIHRTGRARDMDFDLVRKDGRILPVLISADAVLDADGRFVEGRATVADDSERRRAQREREALVAELARRAEAAEALNDSLQMANEELDSFAYAVSHDLRAPLRAIVGFSRALVEDCGDRLGDDARGYLDKIDSAARRMAALIDGILSLARTTRGDLEVEDVDVSALAQRILDELARTSPQRDFGREVDPGLHVHADARMFESVMRNLLDNAWKFSANVVRPRIRVYAGEVDGTPAICVSDNGAGFDQSHSASLFEPFRRLHRQDEFPGLGIGLTTVSRIVKRHGGRIKASSRPGSGATFCVALPRRPADS